MSLRSCWAQGGTLVAGSWALPVLVALVSLALTAGASYAFDSGHDAPPVLVSAEPTPVAEPPAVASPRQSLSLADEANRRGGSSARINVQSGPGRRLSISLFSSGAGGVQSSRQTLALTGLTRSDADAGGDALARLLRSGSASPLHATLYRLDYGAGPFELKGHVADVGARFSLSPGAGEQPSAEDAELIRQVAGGRGLNLSGSWKLAPGLSLTSSRGSLRRDDLLSEQNGITTEDTSHLLALQLGASTSIKASLVQHNEKWDRWLGRAGKQRDEQKVELTSAFGSKGAGAVRLAMASVRSAEGQNRNQENTREAHLSFAPAARLRLSADYVAKESGEESGQTNQTVTAALKLAPDAELAAAMNAFSSSGGEQKRELALSLSAKLLGGQLAAAHKAARGGTGLLTSRSFAFAGQVGGSPRPTNIKLDFQEARGDQPDSPLTRNAFLHLDRQLLPWLTLTAERREAITGTVGGPAVSSEMRYWAAARLGGKTELQAGFVTGAQSGLGRGERRLALSREWSRFRLRAESGSWDDAAGRRSALRYSLEVPTGTLPDWAKTISSIHQFEDAQQYYLKRKPEWLGGEMPFAGYRVQLVQRTGGADGVPTVAFTHRRVLAGRYHLQFNLEQRPEGTDNDGDYKGRPLPLRREAVELGGPVFAGLNLRCGLGLQTRLPAGGEASSDDRLGRVKLGLWGKLHGGQQLEGEVWRETGRWDGAAVERTSVTMIYAHRLSDENRVEFKLGYTWGDEVSGDRSRDCRFALAYDRPI